MHEVGHTLGLRHNFRASRIYTERSSPTRRSRAANGLDRLGDGVRADQPVARRARAAVAPFQTTLGPYDYWAIEYAYKPLAPARPRRPSCERSPARSSEPQLAYGTDEDNFLGIDPEALQFDLGTDPIALREEALRDRARPVQAPGDARRCRPTRTTRCCAARSTTRCATSARAVGVLARQIGGVRTLRDFPGSGRDPLQPVPAASQREALDVLAARPARGRQLRASRRPCSAASRPTSQERSEALSAGEATVATDFSLAAAGARPCSARCSSQLMSDTVAARLARQPERQRHARRGAFAAVRAVRPPRPRRSGASSASGGDIAAAAPRAAARAPEPRRRRCCCARAPRAGPTRAASCACRRRRCSRASTARSQRGALSAEARAHLQDSADTLRQASALQRTLRCSAPAPESPHSRGVPALRIRARPSFIADDRPRRAAFGRRRLRRGAIVVAP